MRHLQVVDENFVAQPVIEFSKKEISKWDNSNILETIKDSLSKETRVYTWRDCLYLNLSLEEIFKLDFLSDDQIDQISEVVKEAFPNLRILTIFDPLEDHLHIGIDLKNCSLAEDYHNDSLFLSEDVELMISECMKELRAISPEAKFKVEKKVRVLKTF